MASNIVDISVLSPFQWTIQGYANPLPYNTKWRQDWQFEDTIGYWDEKVSYLQPWQQNDIIQFQILSNYAPHQLELWDCAGNQKDIFLLNHKMSSISISGQEVYEATVALNSYDEGIYRFVINSGNPVIDTRLGSWFELKSIHETTVLIETTHDQNDHDVIFETGLVQKLRVHGKVGDYLPGSEREVFIGQPFNIVQLSAETFSTGTFIIGDQYGVPDTMIERINLHFACNKVVIDGRQFVGQQGVRFEAKRQDDFPMTGWLFELREADASTKTRSIATASQGSPTTVVYNIQNKGFGSITNPASSNTLQITNLK